MKITRLSTKEYFQTFPSPQHAYNSEAFLRLNSRKVSEVIHLCIGDSKPRLGLSVGQREDGSLVAPFSAPFSGFDFNRRQSAETMLEAARTLRSDFPGLRITIPPPIYSPDMNFRTRLALIAAGASILYSDWNSHIPLAGAYEELLSSPAKNKLRAARRSDFRLIQVNDDPLRAYEIIRLNRTHKGYPLHMSADDVFKTSRILPADFFVLSDGKTDSAAAMVYHSAPGIAQVIYWGNHPDADPTQAPMNLLAALLASHYQFRGFHTLDIGPSSSNGIPSPGLADFKDSIGCQISPKPTIKL